jgi:hypothetical protein
MGKNIVWQNYQSKEVFVIKLLILSVYYYSKLPKNEINRCRERSIDELCNSDTKFDKLTDYILKNDVENALVSFNLQNHFDSVDKRPRTNNHVEGYHRQLNSKPDIWIWISEVCFSS